MVDAHSQEEYADNNIFETDDHKSVIAITPDGNVVSLYSSIKGDHRSELLVQAAIEQGGRKCDCYVLRDTSDGSLFGLPFIYARHGFQPVAFIPFQEQYVIDDPDYQRWREANPNAEVAGVVTMMVPKALADDPGRYNINREPDFGNVPTIEDYDEAMDYTQKVVDREYQENSRIEDNDQPAQTSRKSTGYDFDTDENKADFNYPDDGLIDGYDVNGYDVDGYDMDGFDREGYDERGRDRYGYNRQGYDRQGYDSDGYDTDGYDADGYNRNAFDREGRQRGSENFETSEKTGNNFAVSENGGTFATGIETSRKSRFSDARSKIQHGRARNTRFGQSDLAFNITTNAFDGEGSRLGKTNYEDAKRYDALAQELLRDDLTSEQRAQAEAEMEKFDNREKAIMHDLVTKALSQVRGIEAVDVQQGVGVYVGAREYSSEVHIKAPNNETHNVLEALMAVAQRARQDSVIIGDINGRKFVFRTKNGKLEPGLNYTAQLNLRRPLTPTEQVRLGQAFEQQGLGVTINNKGITALNFGQDLPDETHKDLTPEEFKTLVTNIIHNYARENYSSESISSESGQHYRQDFREQGNEVPQIRRARNSSVDIDNPTGGLPETDPFREEDLVFSNTLSYYTEGKKSGDKRDYSEYIGRQPRRIRSRGSYVNRNRQAEAISSVISENYGTPEYYTEDKPISPGETVSDIATSKKYTDGYNNTITVEHHGNTTIHRNGDERVEHTVKGNTQSFEHFSGDLKDGWQIYRSGDTDVAMDRFDKDDEPDYDTGQQAPYEHIEADKHDTTIYWMKNPEWNGEPIDPTGVIGVDNIYEDLDFLNGEYDTYYDRNALTCFRGNQYGPPSGLQMIEGIIYNLGNSDPDLAKNHAWTAEREDGGTRLNYYAPGFDKIVGSALYDAKGNLSSLEFDNRLFEWENGLISNIEIDGVEQSLDDNPDLIDDNTARILDKFKKRNVSFPAIAAYIVRTIPTVKGDNIVALRGSKLFGNRRFSNEGMPYWFDRTQEPDEYQPRFIDDNIPTSSKLTHTIAPGENVEEYNQRRINDFWNEREQRDESREQRKYEDFLKRKNDHFHQLDPVDPSQFDENVPEEEDWLASPETRDVETDMAADIYGDNYTDELADRVFSITYQPILRHNYKALKNEELSLATSRCKRSAYMSAV